LVQKKGQSELPLTKGWTSRRKKNDFSRGKKPTAPLTKREKKPSTPRWKKGKEGGWLVFLLEDAYQGGQGRPKGTLIHSAEEGLGG